MKHCSYYYKGTLIGDIKALDDFLLEKLPFVPSQGDMVFLYTARQLESIDKIKKASEEKDKLERLYLEAKQNAKNYGVDEEAILRMNRPYVGVSEFLSGQKNERGVLYFPEFIALNYWSNRYHEWAKGNFTDDEIELFFDGDKSKVVPVPLGNINDWRDSNGVYKEAFGTTEQARLRDLMQDKWEHQAKYGTEIHNVLLLYFSKTKSSDKYWYELLEDDKSGAMLKSHFIDNLRKGKITDATTNETIDKILEYAKELRNSLEMQYNDPNDPGELIFYPEFTLSANLNKEYEGRTDLKLLGRVDLLVIDKYGTPHVIDYKTSPKPYEDYNSAKVLNFTYLLATYERMLRRWGFNTINSDITVAPLQMTNFRNENGKWVYDSVQKGTSSKSPLKPLTDSLSEEYLTSNLGEFIEAPLIINGSSENIVSQVSEIMLKFFPKYGDNKKKTDEEIRQLIDEQKGFELNPDTGRYEFLPKGFSKPITATEKEGEAVLFKRVKDYYTQSKERNIIKTANIMKAVRDSLRTGEALDLPVDTDEWVRAKLSKYCDSSWLVMQGEAADAALQFGMILMYNETLDLIEVVKISNSNLKYQNTFGENNKNLTGAHEVDINENSRSDSLILKAVNGNIELIEAMLVLNNLSFNKDVQIGGIQVISPFSTAMGLTASNAELNYNWKKMMSIADRLDLKIDDKFKSKQIKLLTNVEQCYLEFLEVMRRANDAGNKVVGNYKEFEPAVSKLHSAIIPNNVDDMIASLTELRTKLEKNFKMNEDLNADKTSKHSGIQDYDSLYAKTLYQAVNKAILELNNFNVRQALEDHDSWIQSLHILEKGLSGTYIDNAGNFGNLMLNQITSIALEGYLNARDTASVRLRELRTKVEQLKKDAGYSGLLEHTVGNQTSLYDGMTYYDNNGNLMFINPWKDNKLSTKKSEFLKYVILEINKNSYPNLSQQQIEEKIKTDDTIFFQVPLIEGSFASKVHTDGWMGWLKKRLKMFSSLKDLKQHFRDTTSEFFTELDEKQSQLNKEIFEVVNVMDLGNGPKRLDLIQRQRAKYGDGFFERDLESILSTHIWAYSTKNALEDRMPLIKAAYISLVTMGNDLNYTFTKDEKFLREFVANRINHLSIVDEKLKTHKGIVGTLQKAASWMALAFAPVQMTYQSLEGIWKDAKLIITKPDGTETFTLENMKKSAKVVYSELFHYSDDPTVSTAINSLYGINDMDNVAFAENNTSNNHGMFNFFGKFAYKFASRPDFYNRMTIFVAQMMKDGSWEAHSIDPKTKELKYDWKKDKRFAAYANDPTGKNGKTEEWKQAKAMYHTIAAQLVREGVRDSKGNLFKLGTESEPTALPKAYSNKESEAKKAVGDNMYGYYDSTKKSLMLSTFLGGLMMQMRTYWSAKKNQYLAPGGVKAQGKWIQAEQEFIDPNTGEKEKKKMYYSKNEKGEMDPHGPLVPEGDPNASDTPFLQWEGKFEEGILVTLYGMCKEMWNTSISEGWNKYMHNADENLRKAYKANFNAACYDIIMWLLIGGAALLLGDWADDLEKDAKKSGHLDDAIGATFAGLMYKTVYNSKLDMAWWESIFSVSMDWNPFVVSYIGNEAAALGNLLTGDASFSDTMVKSFSAARQIRPMFTYLDQED